MINFKCDRRNFFKAGILVSSGIAFNCFHFCNCEKFTKRKILKKLDFNKLSYCCANCDEGCKIFRATKHNDLEVKKQVALEWSAKYNQDFEPEDVYCYGCRNESVNIGHNLKICTVRKCAKEKQIISCAHCNDFSICENNFWIDWPNMKEKVEEIQILLKKNNLNKS
jgi:hypothetical protein